MNFSTRTSQFDFSVEPFDAAIHYGSPSWPGTVAYHLMDEDTVPVCSPKYEALQRLKKPVDLRRASLLHQSTRTEAWADWFEAMEMDHAHPLRGPRFEQFAMIAQAAVSGLGVALLPQLMIEEELASGKLTLLFGQSIRSARSYYIVLPEVKAASPLANAFTRWIIREAKMSSPVDYS